MTLAGTAAGLGGVALFAASGWAIAEALPGIRTLPIAHRLAYAYLLGVGWIAGGLYALSHLFAVPLRRPAVVALALVAIAAGVTARLRTRAARSEAPRLIEPARRRGPIFFCAAAVAALVTLGLFCDALTDPLRDWDGRMTWAAQARYVRAAGTVDAPVLQDARWYVTHPRYPLLLPLAQVAVLELTGSVEDAVSFRAAYAAFFPVFLLLVDEGARRCAGRRAAALAVLAAALVPFLPFSPEGGAITAYSDLPLACFYGGALLLLLRPRPRLSHGIAAGFLLAAAALAKLEGAPLAIWAALLALLPLTGKGWHAGVRRWTRERLAPAGLAALALLAAVGLRLSWAAAIPERFDENYASLVSLRALGPALARLPLVLRLARVKMFWFPSWSLFWWIAPFLLLLGRHGLRRRVALPLALAAAAPLAIAAAAYAVSEDPAATVLTTWDRFLVQAGIPFFVLLALSLRSVLRRPPGRAVRSADSSAPGAAGPLALPHGQAEV